MATDQPSAATDEERKQRAREKARLRKQRFDAKLRSADAAPDGNPRRGSVLYLSEEARAVLKRNRDRRRDAGLPQVLDASLIESLLLAYAQQGEPGHPEGNLLDDETKSDPRLAKVLAKVEVLETKLRAARSEVETLQEENFDLEEDAKDDEKARPFDWDEIERLLLRAHHMQGRQWTQGIAERFCRELAADGNQARAVEALHRELQEHIRSLTDWVSR